VVLKPDGSLERVRDWCRLELPRYLQPARVEARTELPRTSSGKFDVRAAQSETKDQQ